MDKKIILGLGAASAALLIVALFGVRYLIDSNKTYLLDKAAQSLGRKVTAQRVEVTLWPIGVRLFDAVVTNDLSPTAAEFLQATMARVELRFLPLLAGRFEPNLIALESPTFTIARGDDAQNDDPSRRRPKERSRRTTVKSTTSSSSPQDGRSVLVLLPVQISNGTLRQRRSETASEVVATQIQLRIAGSNTDGPFDIELEAAVMAAKINLKIGGRFGPVAGVQDYRNIPIDGNLQLEALDMGKVNSVIPQLKKGLPKVLQFDGVYSTKGLVFKGTLNNPSLKGAITGSDVSVKFE